MGCVNELEVRRCLHCVEVAVAGCGTSYCSELSVVQ